MAEFDQDQGVGDGADDPNRRWQGESEGAKPGDNALAEAAAPEPEDPRAALIRRVRAPNIAVELDESELGVLGQRIKQEWQIDVDSRSEWVDKVEKALKLAMQVSAPKSYPWPKACLSLDTDILTATGWKPIADVVVGEQVYSRSLSGVAGYQTVTRTFRYLADELVHFEGKSVDLLVTPNHNMLVEHEAPNSPGPSWRFLEAGEFLGKQMQWYYLPMTSEWAGESPELIHGLEPQHYMELLGWYVSEGSAQEQKTLLGNDTFGSIQIAQSQSANPAKCLRICRLLEDSGMSYTVHDTAINVHAKSMPTSLAAEFRSLGKVGDKHLPDWVLGLSKSLLEILLDSMVAGDGCTRVRDGRRPHRTYFTISRRLADQVQEICQKIGLRGTIVEANPTLGGVIKGRQIYGTRGGFSISINAKPRVRCFTLRRTLVPARQEVACVEVPPHNTIYVRRNGKALWVGNSSVVFPLMTTAAMQFAARAYPAIIANKSVVKGVIQGRDDGVVAQDPRTGQPVINPQTGQPVFAVPPGALQARADRIGAHMSWQLLEEMPEWESETDQLLHQLPIVGTVFRKSYFDPAKGRNMSLVVPALKLVVNYWAKSLELAPRATEEIELYPYEIREFERAGLWLERTYSPGPSGGPSGSAPPADPSDTDAPIVFLEQHRWMDLDGDNFPEPYTVTVDRDGAQVVRIVARYEEDGIEWRDGEVARIKPVQFYTQYDFFPSLDGGIYGTGFGQLLGPINESVNTTLNMLIDAGHLANTNGGFIGKNMSMQAGATRWTMGEFKPVNTAGQDIRSQVMPLPFSGPNQTLFALLGTLIDAGKDVASIKDVLAGEQPQANVPATTVLALIEQGQKVFTAIFKRIHRSAKSEFRKLYRLNRIYLADQKDFKVDEQWMQITRADYEAGAGVEPVSDPQMASDMQQLGRAQYLTQFVNNPLVDQTKLLMRLLKAAQIDKPQDLMVQNPQPPPALAVKGMELELDDRRVTAEESLKKAQSIQAIGQAIASIAQADKTVGDQHIAWLSQQLKAAELVIDAAAVQQQGAQDGSGAGSGGGGAPGGGSAPPADGGAGGPGGGPVPSVATPPNLASPPQLPHGLPPGAPAGAITALAGKLDQLGPG